MKKFIVTWKETVTRSIVINALDADCALDIWKEGNYDIELVEETDSTGGDEVEVHEE